MFVSNVPSRRAARRAGARTDHNVVVIAFMMALVFVPVLGMHVAMLDLGGDMSLSAMADSVVQIARRFERQPG